MKNFFLIIVGCIILIIFKVWFMPSILVGGDTVQNYSLNIFQPFVYMWDGLNNNGFGTFVGPFSNAQIITSIIWFLGNILHFDWSSIERIVFLFPEVILGIIIPIQFTNYFLGKKLSHVLAPLIFLLNTYFLLLIAGGQIVVAFSYILIPYLFYRFALLFGSLLSKNIDKKLLFRQALVASFMLSIEIIFDIRFTFLAVFMIGLYGIYEMLFSIAVVKKRLGYIILSTIVLPLLAIVILHAFWLIPTLLIHQDPLQKLGSAYTTVASVQFLSFAKFENALSLLHPNWPENIFGKTYFMRPEFLLLPILAFGSLLFIKNTKDKKEQERSRNILFFSLLGIMGMFLAKGTNDPFGGVYAWMFGHIPGFVMFRDSTKWYICIILSYLLLIPFSVQQIIRFFAEKFGKEKLFSFGIVSGLLLLFCWTIRPAFWGELPGLLHAHTIPQEYVSLAGYLSSDTIFSRVMWVPASSRYGYFSRIHPKVAALTYYQTTSLDGLLTNLQKTQQEAILQRDSIKYVIVPDDVEHEIFLKDRKYDATQYQKAVATLQHISWLKEVRGFGGIHVFEIPQVKDHFWIISQNTKIRYSIINPTKYSLVIQNAKKGDRLIFSDSYDNHWQLQIGIQKLSSIPFENQFNSFVLPQDGSYTATVSYTLQNWVNVGLMISLVSLLGVVGICIYMFRVGNRDKDS